MDIWFVRSAPAAVQASRVKDVKGPAGWYLPCRPASPAYLTTTLELKVTVADMKATLAGIPDKKSAPRKSMPVYSAGLLWTLKLDVYSSSGLWLAVHVEGLTSLQEHSMRKGIPIKRGVTCDRKVSIQSDTPLVLHAHSLNSTDTVGSGELMCSHVPLEGAHPDSSQWAWWAPHVVDGCVHFLAEITKIAIA